MGAFDDVFGNSRGTNSGLIEREPFYSLSYDCDVNKLHSYKNTEVFNLDEYERALAKAAEMLVQQRDPRLVYVGRYGGQDVILQVKQYEVVVLEKKKQIEKLNKEIAS